MEKSRAHRRGRVYRCGKCGLEKERARVISHFLQEHLSDDQIPYLCQICGYRASDGGTWERHLTLPMHKKEIGASLEEIDSQTFLRKAKDARPLRITTDKADQMADIYELSREESKEVWSRASLERDQKPEKKGKKEVKRRRKNQNAKQKNSEEREQEKKVVQEEEGEPLQDKTNVQKPNSQPSVVDNLMTALKCMQGQMTSDLHQQLQNMLRTQEDELELQTAVASIVEPMQDNQQNDHSKVFEEVVPEPQREKGECPPALQTPVKVKVPIAFHGRLETIRRGGISHSLDHCTEGKVGTEGKENCTSDVSSSSESSESSGSSSEDESEYEPDDASEKCERRLEPEPARQDPKPGQESKRATASPSESKKKKVPTATLR